MSQLFRTILPKLLHPYTHPIKSIAVKFSDLVSVTENEIDNNVIIADSDKQPLPENLKQWEGNDFDIAENPLISEVKYEDEHRFYFPPRQVWIENFDTIKEKKLGLAVLHPDVFGAQPRLEVIHQNIHWQKMYRWVSFANSKIVPEKKGSLRKPWPQKGTGRARHGSRKGVIWKGGGRAHGPRSPTTHFYMLPFFSRVIGLTSCLSVKLAQDDLHIVNNLEIPTDDPDYIKFLMKERKWGPSVLIVDNNDVMPINLSIATDSIKHVNLMPVYGLNVYSMLKHDTLVLSLAAARLIEERITFNLNRIDGKKVMEKFKVSSVA